MIVVDDEIRELVSKGVIELSDFCEECVQPASYDLRVGEEGYTAAVGSVISIEDERVLEVQPGDFALVLTHERLRLPTNMVGRFGLRSAYARMGLLATSGPQVDPGFEGKLVIGVVNFGPQTIELPHLQPFCTLELHRLDRSASAAYAGPYQGQEHLSDEIISTGPKEPFPLAVMLIRQLAAISPSVASWNAPTFPARERGKGHLIFQREKRAFERLKPQLLKTHRGEYVVIHGGEPVMFGHDMAQLASQAYEKFGYGPLYVDLVEEEPEIAHLPTPRVWRE